MGAAQKGRCGKFCRFLWNLDDLGEVRINIFLGNAKVALLKFNTS